PVPHAWPASSRTVYRRMLRGTGERTATATSARHAPSPGRPAAAHTRGPAGPWPGADAPTQRPPYEDRTPWRDDSPHATTTVPVDNSKKRKVLEVPVQGAQKLKWSQAAGERHPITRARHPPAKSSHLRIESICAVRRVLASATTSA